MARNVAIGACEDFVAALTEWRAGNYDAALETIDASTRTPAEVVSAALAIAAHLLEGRAHEDPDAALRRVALRVAEVRAKG